MKINKKVVLSVAVILILFGIGKIIAFQVSKAQVKNSLKAMSIDVELNETDRKYMMVPGTEVPKDPAITVAGGNGKCYLFAELTCTEKFQNMTRWSTATGWNRLETADRPFVYWRVVEPKSEPQVFQVLKDDKVVVKDEITASELRNSEADELTMTVKAYAYQYAKTNHSPFTPEEAWNLVKRVQ